MHATSIKTIILAGAFSIMSHLNPVSSAAKETNVKLTITNPDGLYDPAPNGYSHAVITSGSSRTVYIAGQGGEDETGILSTQFSDQVKQAYANLAMVLEAVGAKPEQVAKITTYVVDYDESKLGVMTKYVEETFGDALPAQSLVPVPRLALDGMLFEVEAVAVLD